MLPNATKIPSSFLILQRRACSYPARTSRTGDVLRLRTTKSFGRSFSEKAAPQPPQTGCPPPKFPKQKKGYGFRTTFTAIGVGTAVVVAYAKYDEDFRQLIKDNSPGFDSFISVITQEEASYSESFDSFMKAVNDRLNAILCWGTSPDGAADAGRVPKPCPPPPGSDYKAPPSVFEPMLDASIKDDEKFEEVRIMAPPSPESPRPDPITIADTERAPPSAPFSDLHPKNVIEIEKRIGEYAELSINSFAKAVCAMRDHAEEVDKLLDTRIDKVDPYLWTCLRAKTQDKEKLVQQARTAASDAENNIKQLEKILNDPGLDAMPPLKDQARANLRRMKADIAKAKQEMQIQMERTSITDKYWQKVEEARLHFREEIEILFPHVKIDEKVIKINPNDLDLFMMHAFQHVVFYQKELIKLQTIGEHRIKQALETCDETYSDTLIQARVAQELDKEKKLLMEDLQRKVLSARAEAERELKQQMKRHMEVSDDHLSDALKAKENEVRRLAKREMEERMMAEKDEYKKKLAEMTGRMQGLDEAIIKRTQNDHQTLQAHVLFSACQSLFRALRCGVPGIHWTKALRPLQPEITAVSTASGGKDSLVERVLQSIPAEAKDRGVFPEFALRERFLKLERVARRVALVKETGGSLPRYLLSYIQSLMLLRPVNPIPPSELNDDKCNLNDLDNFDILQRARYWVDRGDFGMTLRYMNLLTGASKQVSCDWMKEARIYLETQQAATVLMAHAGAVGLLYF